MSRSIVARILGAAVLLVPFLILISQAQPAKRPGLQELVRPDPYLDTRSAPLERVKDRLARPQAWERFFSEHGRDFHVFVDLRSGTPVNLLGHVPLLPGRGADNRVTLKELEMRIGRPVTKVDAQTVTDAIQRFLELNREALGMDLRQLGAARATQVVADLWQVEFTQQVKGVPVRGAGVFATVKYGNLLGVGTWRWGNATLNTRPRISSQDAAASVAAYTDGRLPAGATWGPPTLEILPQDAATPGTRALPGIGEQYSHRLVWSLGLRGVDEAWQATVDAVTGDIVSFVRIGENEQEKIEGGVYPSANTGTCASPGRCGVMRAGTPMPWADTGLASPNDFTNGAGVFEHPAGTTVTTHLTGKFITMTDLCGSLTEKAPQGRVDLLGTNGQHDCAVERTSHGNSQAARTVFHEANRMAEVARGWLPLNGWLLTPTAARSNETGFICNARHDINPVTLQSTIGFVPSGFDDYTGFICRNTGEIASIIDHEWGHAFDHHDANPNGSLEASVPGEAFADIVAQYRQRESCHGYGMRQSGGSGVCGIASDGSGPNVDESQLSGTPHCTLDCSGTRDLDWDKHADHTPDTPQNFTCPLCRDGGGCSISGSPCSQDFQCPSGQTCLKIAGEVGPCGKQTHCESAPVRQAAWDLVARDLRTSPFSYGDETAFTVGSRLFHLGAAGIVQWYQCTPSPGACSTWITDGCLQTNAYMQWLMIDDDNGNVNDGTPHMTAIYSAFNRHNLACQVPAPVNSGCPAAPTATPVLTATVGVDGHVTLSWTSVSGALRYWVFRSDGASACGKGKAKIAEVTGMSYVDTEVADGMEYGYSVLPVGDLDECYGPASTCQSATVECTPLTEVPLLVSPANGATGAAGILDWNDVTSTGWYTVQVATDSGFSNFFSTSPRLGLSDWIISPNLQRGATYYWRVRTESNCGPGAWSAARSFTTCSGSTAAYDTPSKAPKCAAAGCACDSGTLVDSRDTILVKPELNQPNTINNSCPDGISGTYHMSPSVDKIVVRSPSLAKIRMGTSVVAEATVYCFSTNNRVNLFYSSSATNPSWTLVGSLLPCPGVGVNTLSQTFTIANLAGMHAVRARIVNFSGGAPPACQTPVGPTQDTDDLIFAAASCTPCTVSFCSANNQRCTYNNSCGQGGCCSYTCVFDESCGVPDPCPPNACNGCS